MYTVNAYGKWFDGTYVLPPTLIGECETELDALKLAKAYVTIMDDAQRLMYDVYVESANERYYVVADRQATLSKTYALISERLRHDGVRWTGRLHVVDCTDGLLTFALTGEVGDGREYYGFDTVIYRTMTDGLAGALEALAATLRIVQLFARFPDVPEPLRTAAAQFDWDSIYAACRAQG